MKLSATLPIHFTQKGDYFNGLGLLLRYVRLHLDIYQQRRMLIELPDERLQDMGISRHEALQEARRLIIDMPEEQLMTRMLTDQDK